jgi:hypothetical protein
MGDGDRRRKRNPRGVFERERGSGVWSVGYFDEYGKKHCEKVGPKGLAVAVYRKRKTEIAERRFFPYLGAHSVKRAG